MVLRRSSATASALCGVFDHICAEAFICCHICIVRHLLLHLCRGVHRQQHQRVRLVHHVHCSALFSCGPSAAASRRSLQTHLHSERTNKRHHHHLCGVFDHICAEARPVPLSAWSSTAPVLPETFICCHMESFICGRIDIVRRLRPHLCRDIGPGCFLGGRPWHLGGAGCDLSRIRAASFIGCHICFV